MSEVVFDAGLQAERTLLAWRRTCLSAAAGAVILMRVTAGSLGTLAIGAALAAIALAGIAYIESARRYRLLHLNLIKGSGPPAPGVAVAMATVSTGTLAVTCLTWLIVVNQ